MLDALEASWLGDAGWLSNSLYDKQVGLIVIKLFASPSEFLQEILFVYGILYCRGCGEESDAVEIFADDPTEHL